MATLTTASQLTFLELANRLQNKTLLAIAEVLSEDNEWLKDAVWLPSNQPTSHVHLQRLSEPTGSLRRINQGVATEASQTQKVTEPFAMYEAESVIDERLVQLARDKKAFRSGEDLAFLAGMFKNVSGDMLYGSIATEPDGINGLLTRRNALGTHCVSGSGTGSDLMSALAVQWGKDRVHLIYPEGSSTMGIKAEDRGRQRILDSSSNPYWAWVTRFYFDVGIVVRDDRCLKRYANIESSGSTNIFDEDKLIALLNGMKERGKGAVIYVNETLMTQMEIRMKDKTNVNLTLDTAFGEPIMRFRGHPVRLWEQMLITESAVS